MTTEVMGMETDAADKDGARKEHRLEHVQDDVAYALASSRHTRRSLAFFARAPFEEDANDERLLRTSACLTAAENDISPTPSGMGRRCQPIRSLR